MRSPELAVLLIAGGGIRLRRYTEETPKCMVKVAGKPLLERMLGFLSLADIKRSILVVGHRSQLIRQAIGDSWQNMEIKYIENLDWQITNNVVSLALAIDHICDDFLLLEGDLIFTYEAFEKILGPDRIAIDIFQPYMDGTAVILDSDDQVDKFYLKSTPEKPERWQKLYKTVNIYSFRASTFHKSIVPRLCDLIERGENQVYYEQAIAQAVDSGDVSLKAVSFAGTPWYEIDTVKDLKRAEALFADLEE